MRFYPVTKDKFFCLEIAFWLNYRYIKTVKVLQEQ